MCHRLPNLPAPLEAPAVSLYLAFIIRPWGGLVGMIDACLGTVRRRPRQPFRPMVGDSVIRPKP
jgi:hypothetical protein